MSKLLDKIRRRQLVLDHIRHNYKDFLIKQGEELTEKIIIKKIKQKMMLEGFSNKIYDNTKIKEVKFVGSKLRISIRSEYTTESGFDVAVAREYGTDVHKPDHRHKVMPRVKLALSWVQKGIRLFSKGHYVSGIKSLHIIDQTIESGKPELIKALNKSIVTWKRSLLKSI